MISRGGNPRLLVFARSCFRSGLFSLTAVPLRGPARARAIRRGGRSALPRLRLGFFGSRLFRFAGLRGRALTGRRAFALASALPRVFLLTAIPLRGPPPGRPNGRASMACRAARGMVQYGPFSSLPHRYLRPPAKRLRITPQPTEGRQARTRAARSGRARAGPAGGGNSRERKQTRATTTPSKNNSPALSVALVPGAMKSYHWRG